MLTKGNSATQSAKGRMRGSGMSASLAYSPRQRLKAALSLLWQNFTQRLDVAQPSAAAWSSTFRRECRCVGTVPRCARGAIGTC